MRPIRQRVGGVLDISIEVVDQLPIGPTGKRGFVDQKLEVVSCCRPPPLMPA